MRCILGLATAGLVILSGTATADTQSPPNHIPDPPVAQSVADPPPWPPRPIPTPPVPPRPIPIPIPTQPIATPPVPVPPWPTSIPRPPWGQPIPPPPIPAPMPPRPPWPTAGGPYAKHLTLTVSRIGRTRTIRLGCTPLYGPHPEGSQACSLLLRAQGDPARIRLPWRACPQYYEPITVTATGTWNGRFIRYQRTFSNQCELRTATGPIFSF
ncbi:SSI family serine proteinase inhibitor [Streptosporangium sp. NPDC049078]|uniref:SSI family serine proteinase inhibitor n=1 Tax=Streptosporangium sp. NPDC049078 TaxID=3155767 RepID=UPI00343C1930